MVPQVTEAVKQTKDEALISSISDGIIVRDKERKVIKVNPAFTAILGYTETELQARRVRDIITVKHPNGKLLSLKDMTVDQALITGKPAGGTYVWTRKDGSEVVVDVTTSPYLIDGQLEGTVTVIRDISEQASVDKAKTEFVSLAAHQLRTPLSSINWYLEMLADDPDSQLSEQQRDNVSEIMIANQRMVDLVNDLLNVSRIDLGTFAVKPVPTNLERIIKDCLDESENLITQKSLHITTAFTGPVDNYKIDPQLARIVFQNLISNAVKYTPERGSIDVYAILDDRKLQITIADTGYGIPKHQQSKIFNKLFRADNVIKRDTEGTGLGLYLVKAIVEKAGGTINFSSRVNAGTTFTVEFPRQGMKRHSGHSTLAPMSRL